MTGMSERVDKLVKNVGNIETNIENINKMDDLTAEKVSKLEDEMVKMVEKTDATDSKISSMQSKLSATDSKINGIKSDVSSTMSKMSSMSLKINEVEKKVSWIFVGMGNAAKYADVYSVDGLTLVGCFGVCTNKRSSDSKWNGLLFHPSDGICHCLKNDGGHVPSNSKTWMHFITL